MSEPVQVVTTELFHQNLREIKSARTLRQVAKSLTALSTFPNMGRLSESVSIVSRFGKGVRTLVCGNYLLVYLYEDGQVTALTLYPARLVR